MTSLFPSKPLAESFFAPYAVCSQALP